MNGVLLEKNIKAMYSTVSEGGEANCSSSSSVIQKDSLLPSRTDNNCPSLHVLMQNKCWYILATYTQNPSRLKTFKFQYKKADLTIR